MKKNILMLAAAAVMFCACDDLLDKEPQSKLSPETYFKTATDLQLFTNPYYNNLLPKTFYNEQSDQYVHQDPSDLVKSGTNRYVPASGGGWSWGDLRRINTCLDYIPKQCEDPAAAAQYTALSRFFRAYFYFDKVKRFGDVPWIDHELGSSDPDLQRPRDSREFIMQRMIEDVDYAIENLPDSYGGKVYRATKWAALAFKARFCLFEGTYRKYHTELYDQSYVCKLPEDANDYKYYLRLAAEAAKEIMDKGPFKLYSTGKPELDYAVLFSSYDAQASEAILAINFDYGTQLMHNATAFAIEAGRGACLTKKFVDAYLMKDGTRFTEKEGWETMQFAEEVADRDPRLAQTIRIPGYARVTEKNGSYSYAETKTGVDANCAVTGYQTAKFVMPDNNLAFDKLDKSYNDLMVFRFGEVLLNYAEAKAELGELDQDAIDESINLLRDRAGMPHLNANVTADPYLQTEAFYPDVTDPLILEVRRERAIELAQEGFRYYDLMRWKRGELLAQPYYGIYFPGPGKYDIDGDGVIDYNIYVKGQGTEDKTITKNLIIGEGIFLSEGEKGLFMPVHNILFTFNPVRDYLYPIPINDRSLNNNLTQNPGWDDGLDF
ncbi:MAG: RagB/SusD family nutrient uptake outer membrane protein [Candidatus Cryptobacteroides sp.]